MDFSDATLPALRVFREVADRGSLSAAAIALGYTQSAVSRQVANLERAAGRPLLERRHDGVRLTEAGHVVLRGAAAVADQIDSTARELAGVSAPGPLVRLGWFASAGAALVPRALAAMAREHPAIAVRSREGTTPALVRALRARRLDLAVVSSSSPHRPLDDETPALHVLTLVERPLLLAVPSEHALAKRVSVDVAELRGLEWIAGPGIERVLGVWPGLGERPTIAHVTRDWLAKLTMVAAGLGVTTVPGALAAAVPPGVTLITVHGPPEDRRRVHVARLPGPLPEPAARLLDALRAAAG